MVVVVVVNPCIQKQEDLPYYRCFMHKIEAIHILFKLMPNPKYIKPWSINLHSGMTTKHEGKNMGVSGGV